jgi:hypothetical protein
MPQRTTSGLSTRSNDHAGKVKARPFGAITRETVGIFGKYNSTRFPGQVLATLTALLTAAAPPPTTITEPAWAGRIA